MIPAIAKSTIKRLPSRLESLVAPHLSSPTKSSTWLDTLSAILNLLHDKSIHSFYKDILIYLETCMVEDNIFLLTNDNHFYQSLARHTQILEVIWITALVSVASYNERHCDFLVFFYPSAVVRLSNFIDFQ